MLSPKEGRDQSQHLLQHSAPTGSARKAAYPTQALVSAAKTAGNGNTGGSDTSRLTHKDLYRCVIFARSFALLPLPSRSSTRDISRCCLAIISHFSWRYLKCQHGVPPAPIAAQLHLGQKGSRITPPPCRFSCVTDEPGEELTLSGVEMIRGVLLRGEGTFAVPRHTFCSRPARTGLDAAGGPEARLHLLLSPASQGDQREA